MINVASFDHNDCCGCGVCSKICPKNIISMESDKEGFLYPVIKNISSCINCGLCVKYCPTQNRKNAVEINFDAPNYAYHSKSEVCQGSSSGGVAAGLYKFILRNNGVVFGVRYSEDFTDAEYVMVESEEQIGCLLGSKYLKANINNLYETVQNQVNKDILVLVVGLPCEIAALRNYLKKDYNNLYLCELICHGPTSNIVLRQFVDSIEKKENGRVVYLNQRAKKPYWKPYFLDVKLDNGREICVPFTDSDYEKAFQIMKRPSCNSCAFKDGMSCSDMIIGDFHGANKESAEYNQYGVSICFPCSAKAKEILEILKGEDYIVGDAARGRAMGNRALYESIPRLGIRDRYVNLLLTKGLHAAGSDPLVRFYLKKRKIVNKIRMRLKIHKNKVKIITKVLDERRKMGGK